MRALAMLLCVLAVQTPVVCGQPARDPLRPQSREARDVVEAAIACSPTVAALVDELSRLDVIAVIELERVRGLADGEFLTLGRLSLLASTPAARLVRIRLVAPPGDHIAVALLAHELHHATEVAREPEVRDQIGMRRLYTRIGFAGASSHFETDEAFEVGARVRREISSACLADVRAGRRVRPVSRPATTTLVASK